MIDAVRHGELMVLLDALCEGELTAEQQTALDALLAKDEDARRTFVYYMDVVAELHWQAGEKQFVAIAEAANEQEEAETNTFPQPTEHGPRRRRFSMAQRHLAVGVAIGAAFVVMSLSVAHRMILPERVAKEADREKRESDDRARSIESVARLVADADAQWRGDVENPVVGRRQQITTGMRLYPGQKLVLTSGLAEFKFFNGAEVVLEAPAEFEVLGKKQCWLGGGKLVAKAHEERSKGFIVDTPTATFEDLGTEFGVNVRKGFASVHVFDGEVELATTDNEGETIRRVVTKDEVVDVSMVDGRPTIAAHNDATGSKFVRVLDGHLSQTIIERLAATEASVRGDFDGTVGFTFTVAKPIAINSLGLWDGPGNEESLPVLGRIGDGLAENARVGLWNDTTGELLASASVPSGVDGRLIGDFRYVTLNERKTLTLEPGTEYCLGVQFTKSGNVFADSYQELANPSRFSVRGGSNVMRGDGSRFAMKEFSMPTRKSPSRTPDRFRWFIGPNAAFIDWFAHEKSD